MPGVVIKPRLSTAQLELLRDMEPGMSTELLPGDKRTAATLVRRGLAVYTGDREYLELTSAGNVFWESL
jgi:hypothetical protein